MRAQQSNWVMPAREAWGSEFVCMQVAGHINIESGHREFPLGVALLQSLAGESSLKLRKLGFPSSDSSTPSVGALETA